MLLVGDRAQSYYLPCGPLYSDERQTVACINGEKLE
jgi:hypothetical protein